jgi:2-alkyl-3-oxoalkanoate reductase
MVGLSGADGGVKELGERFNQRDVCNQTGEGMNRVLVTGGGGFIGKALVRELIGRGIETAVVGRNPYPDLESLGVRCFRGDIRDEPFLDQALAGYDTVFHVAAKAGIWGPRQEYFAINTTGTSNVINACRKNGVSCLVYTSTPSVVFDRFDLEGVDETTAYAVKPLCHYAASKILAEQEILLANSADLRTIAIRPHLVWGPGDQHLIPRLLDRGRSKALKIVGSGHNRVDITYIDNVVHAHILAAENLATKSHCERAPVGLSAFIGQHGHRDGQARTLAERNGGKSSPTEVHIGKANTKIVFGNSLEVRYFTRLFRLGWSGAERSSAMR